MMNKISGTNKNILKYTALGITSVLIPSLSACHNKEKAVTTEYPNIVYIIADDLGYGDLSCYGQKKFSTPNIDKLAEEGMLFTQHYSGCTVSAPSRSSLVTGLHTGHTPIRGNKSIEPEGQYPIPDSTVTIAEILKTKGYATGVFGKWGLGFIDNEGAPLKQGFDEFSGYYCQALAHNYYPYYLWHNNDKILLPNNAGNRQGFYAPDVYHQDALDFIRRNADKPFFLFYTTVIPHAELIAPEEQMAKFRGKFEPKDFKGVEEGSPSFKKGGYGSQPDAHAAFAAMITTLDQQVGEIVAELKKAGIEDKTLVIFTSDNGPHFEGGADPDYFDSNGPLKGYKRSAYEGGIRVPMIAKWPGKIAKGTTTDHISAFWDVMPTFAEMTGATITHKIDGISFLPTLLGKEGQKEHEYLYWEFHEQGGKISVRKDNWKAVWRNYDKIPQGKMELYDLSNDIGETNDLADKHPDIVKMMKNYILEAHEPSEVFPFKFEKKESN